MKEIIISILQVLNRIKNVLKEEKITRSNITKEIIEEIIKKFINIDRKTRKKLLPLLQINNDQL
jgi:hypothetical protein